MILCKLVLISLGELAAALPLATVWCRFRLTQFVICLTFANYVDQSVVISSVVVKGILVIYAKMITDMAVIEYIL